MRLREGIFMLEYLYFSVLDNGSRFEFVSLDTLTNPLDFADAIDKLRSEHRSVAIERSLNETEVYGCFGCINDVAIFKDVVTREAYDLHEALGQSALSEGVEPIVQTEYNKYGSAIKNACIEILRNRSIDSNLSICHREDNESEFAFLLITSGEVFPTKEKCQIALNQYADQWLHQQEPFLLKHQVLTNSFMLDGLRGKRIIAPHFNAASDCWELLLEGARRFSLKDSPLYLGEQTDSSVTGNWTEPEVEMILLNPAYGFGIMFQPFEAIENWLKSLLYCCALSFYSKGWNVSETKKVYLALLEELKRRFPYEEVPPIVDEQTFITAFLESARRCADSLRGIEESSLTMRFAKEMPYCAYQLKKVAEIVESILPQKSLGLDTGIVFDQEKYCSLMEGCNASTSHDKGMALEDLAAYLLDTLSGWKLAGRRVRADDCEIDLCYVNASLRQKDWDLGSMLLVECKNRVEITGISVLRNLSFVMDAKGAKTGVIISLSGFTKVVREQVLRLAMQDKKIILIDADDLMEIAGGLSPEECLFGKRDVLLEEIEDDFGLLV